MGIDQYSMTEAIQADKYRNQGATEMCLVSHAVLSQYLFPSTYNNPCSSAHFHGHVSVIFIFQPTYKALIG